MRLAIIFHSTVRFMIWSGFKIFFKKTKTKFKLFSNLNPILVCQMKTKRQEKLAQRPSMETGTLHRSEIPATQEDELGGS